MAWTALDSVVVALTGRRIRFAPIHNGGNIRGVSVDFDPQQMEGAADAVVSDLLANPSHTSPRFIGIVKSKLAVKHWQILMHEELVPVVIKIITRLCDAHYGW